MSAEVWSWVAAGVSILGLWIGGINPKVGWIFGIGNQVVWTAYGLATSQPGMIALSVAFVAIYGRNLWRWRGTQFQPARQQATAEQAA